MSMTLYSKCTHTHYEHGNRTEQDYELIHVLVRVELHNTHGCMNMHDSIPHL